jgi:hypothetical protein
MLFFPTTDEDAAYFRSQGYTGSIDDMHFKALGDLGYTGSLNDRIRACLTFKYGSYYEAMRDLRNGTSVFALSSYIINGFDPALVFDFKGDYFRKSATTSTFAASITHARASSATMMNSSGTLVTVGNNVPRTGHHIYNGSAWVNEGILHESEARTNLLTYSNDLTGASWLTTEISNTANAGVSPDGTSNANKVVPTTSSGIHYTYQTLNFFSTDHSFSVYVASAGYGFATICAGTTHNTNHYAVVIDLSNGTQTALYSMGTHSKTVTVEPVGSFYRVTISGDGEKYYVVGASDTGTYTPSSYGFKSFSGDGTSGILVYGAQAEAGTTPSSYIPTGSSTVTRAAETLTVPAANLPYDNTNMSIQIDGKMTYADRNTTLDVQPYRWQLSSSNYIDTRLTTSGGRTGQPVFAQRDGTSGYDTSEGGTNVYSPGTNVPFNLAGRYGSTFINGAHEGTLLTANTTPTALPDLSATDLELGNIFMGTIGQFRMWDEDLTDAGIVEAST